MPELPEVERVRRPSRRPWPARASIACMLQPARSAAAVPRRLRSAARAARRVRALARRGKYLLGELSSGDTLVMHLGMSGWFRVERRDAVGDATARSDRTSTTATITSCSRMSSGMRSRSTIRGGSASWTW